MDPKKISESKVIRRTVIGIGIFVIALLIFQAGVFVGYKKAGFSYKLGENYFFRGFGGQMMGGMRSFFDADVPGGHGVTGQVVKTASSTLVIEGLDDVERIVVTDPSTQVRRFRDVIRVGDIKTGDRVIILGNPDDKGQIEAKLIRLVPPLPTSTPPIY